jgi:hypothetical protein
MTRRLQAKDGIFHLEPSFQVGCPAAGLVLKEICAEDND